MILGYNKNSLLYRVLTSKRKSNGEICFFDISNLGNIGLTENELLRTFFFQNKILLSSLFGVISKFKRMNEIVFISSLFDFEELMIFYLAPKLSSKSNSILKASIIKKVTSLYEHGFYLNFYDSALKVSENLMQRVEKYTSVNQLMDSLMIIKNLSLDYFLNPIIFVFFICTFIFFTFIAHLIINKFIKCIKYFNLKIKIKF